LTSSPVYIPCASGNNAQTDCLFRIAGSLIELLGYPTMHFAPYEARRAAQTLWTMADSIEGKKTPRIDSTAGEGLVNAAVAVLRDASDPSRWPGDLKNLKKALDTLTGAAE
jgi:hypothetical protein